MSIKKPVKKATHQNNSSQSHLGMLPEIKRETKNLISNGLESAILGNELLGMGSQLSQVDTLFRNNRWYLVSNMRQILSEIYVEHGLVRTIVDVPVDDGMRGGIEIQSKQLSPEDIQKLQTAIDREGDLNKIAQALKWNRLFGGAGVVIITDQDPATPLDLNAINESSKLQFRAVDMWELFWSKQATSDTAAAMDGSQLGDVEHYDYYGIHLHKSRVLKMKGLEAPSFIRQRLRGWGFSVMEALVRSINQYLKANNLTFEVLDEFKLDIFKIKGLASSMLNKDGEEKIRRRVNLANKQKNFQNAISMDAEDDYIQKQLSFAGLAEAMEGIRMQVASDMRMPLTKIFGISAAGFSSGEDDIENYNAMVESEVRQKSKYDILRLVEIRCQKLFGYMPDDLSISFKPLRVLSSEQEENVKTQKFNRLLQAKSAGLISSKEFRDAVNKDNLLNIQLDTSLDSLEMDGTQQDKASELDGSGEDF